MSRRRPFAGAHTRVLSVAALTAAVLVASSSGHPVSVAPALCQASYWRTYLTCVDVDEEGNVNNNWKPNHTFVRTGDYPQLWIRDSAAQVNVYNNKVHGHIVAGLIRTQAFFIEHNAYANSFQMKKSDDDTDPNKFLQGLGRTGYIGTYNYEFDSGSYFFRLIWNYWQFSGELIPVQRAVWRMLHTWHTEQKHDEKSEYRYYERGLGQKGGCRRGVQVGQCKVNESSGLSWSAYRPSDDDCEFGYHIPDHFFAMVTLGYVQKMASAWNDKPMKHMARRLQTDFINGVKEHGTHNHPKYGKIYCYEVDGFGGCKLMDDANVPNLLSLPYLDKEGLYYDKEIYENTKKFILSKDNPYYFEGANARGLGSPHTMHGRVWHMGIAMQGLVEPDPAKKRELLEMLVRNTDNFMHESFDPNRHQIFTRAWFTWPDTLFAELCEQVGMYDGVPPRPKKMTNNNFFLDQR